MGAGAARPIVLIVEPHLEGTAGHPIRYTRVLAEALASGGAHVEVLASRRFPRDAMVGAPVRRVFERPIYREWNQPIGWRVKLHEAITWLRQRVRGVGWSIWVAIYALERPVGWNVLWPRAYRVLHASALFSFLRRLLGAAVLVCGVVILGPFYLLAGAVTVLFGRDTTLSTVSPFATAVLRAVQRAEKHGPVRIVVPTATLGILAELLALPVMHDGPLPPLYLLFHDHPDLWANWYRPTAAEGVAGRIRASGWGPMIHLYATTEAAAERLRRALGPELYVRSVEDIFTPADLDRIRGARMDRPAETALAPHEAGLAAWLAERRTEGLRVALVPGPMRLDKGVRDLQALVADLDSPAGKSFALVVQRSHQPDWLAPFFRNASVHPRVHVVDQDLSDLMMHGAMSDADIILLPYRREDYATRISSVLTEAVLHARPILVTAGIAVQASFRDTPSCRFVAAWRDWPAAAAEVIEEAAADRGALAGYAAGLDRRLRRRPAWRTRCRTCSRPRRHSTPRRR